MKRQLMMLAGAVAAVSCLPCILRGDALAADTMTNAAANDTIPKTGVVANWAGGYDTYTVNERNTRKVQNKQPCPKCHRKGKVAVKKDVACTACKGKGWILVGRPYDKSADKVYDSHTKDWCSREEYIRRQKGVQK